MLAIMTVLDVLIINYYNCADELIVIFNFLGCFGEKGHIISGEALCRCPHDISICPSSRRMNNATTELVLQSIRLSDRRPNN